MKDEGGEGMLACNGARCGAHLERQVNVVDGHDARQLLHHSPIQVYHALLFRNLRSRLHESPKRHKCRCVVPTTLKLDCAQFSNSNPPFF
jgi:hypothetical protein